MADVKDYLITDLDLVEKGVSGQGRFPELKSPAMQRKFDELVLDVVRPKYNGLVYEIEGQYATKAYVADQMFEAGAGDMVAERYDPDEDGIVAAADVAERAKNGIDEYAHRKSGSVHLLNKEGGTTNIKFIATADFAAGDTFSVNGTACTAQTSDGEPLPDGYFVAGAVVSAFQSGSILNFKSGGAALNFKVVGGTTQPESPSENTIWVNTDIGISSWAFDVTEPNAPAEGMVWFRTNTASSAPFNALKKNKLYVYTNACMQYVGGAWANKVALIYQNGEWKSFSVYLLKGADLCTENGGTWSDSGWSVTSGTGWSKAGYSITDEGIVINNPSSTNNVKWGMCGKQEAVNISGYNTLTIVYDITVKTTDNLYFAVCDSKMNINTGTPAARLILPKGQEVYSYTQTIDVSALEGDHYFAFALLRQGAITVKEVYLT